MSQQRGGRGKKAPYETKLMRVPEPIANQVENLCQQYQDFLVSGGNPVEPPSFLVGSVEVQAVQVYEPPPAVTYYKNQDCVRVRQCDSLPQTQRTKRLISKYEGKCGKVVVRLPAVKGQRKYSVSFSDVGGFVEFFGSEIELVDRPWSARACEVRGT
jgi:hypothetical protein